MIFLIIFFVCVSLLVGAAIGFFAAIGLAHDLIENMRDKSRRAIRLRDQLEYSSDELEMNLKKAYKEVRLENGTLRNENRKLKQELEGANQNASTC